MIYAGAPYAHEIDFSTGLPTGAVVYSLLGNNGQPIAGYDSVSVTPGSGAVSLMILIPGTANTVATPLFETRTLLWVYTNATGVVSDRIRYRVERDIVFPVTNEGVRAKLGVEEHEVPDDKIDLLKGYADLASLYTPGVLDPYATSGDRNTMLVSHAIEAMAALTLIPALRLGIAKKESSGTNTYERFATMDWEALVAGLTGYITPINDLVEPLIDPTNYSLIFFAVSRNDPFTGEAAL